MATAANPIQALLSKASAFEVKKPGPGKFKLHPYRDVIIELRKKGATPRMIAEWMEENAGMKISATAVVNYMKKTDVK